jgi:hypothetical protein
MYALLEPKKVTIDDKEFIISKFPATVGREIITNYPTSAIPKIGEYSRNQELMFKLMSHVAVEPVQGQQIRLNSQALIDNHVPNWESLLKLEAAMMEYNCSFFQNGRLSTFLSDTVEKLPKWISRILTDLSAQSLPTVEQRSTNSEPSTL